MNMCIGSCPALGAYICHAWLMGRGLYPVGPCGPHVIRALTDMLFLAQAEGARMLHEVVTEADIADIISKWTGIPVSKLLASEREKLLHLSEELHKRVIGQNEAVEAVADAIMRYESHVFCVASLQNEVCRPNVNLPKD
jgi:hypothetical protein